MNYTNVVHTGKKKITPYIKNEFKTYPILLRKAFKASHIGIGRHTYENPNMRESLLTYIQDLHHMWFDFFMVQPSFGNVDNSKSISMTIE